MDSEVEEEIRALAEKLGKNKDDARRIATTIGQYERAAEEIDTINKDTRNRIRELGRDIAGTTDPSEKTSLMGEQESARRSRRRRIREINDGIPERIGDDLDMDTYQKIGRIVRRAGMAGIAILGFLTSEAHGAVEVMSNSESSLHKLTQRAIAGDCKWVFGEVRNSQTNMWNLVHTELLLANVKTASEITNAYFAKLRNACRPAYLSGRWVGFVYRCDEQTYYQDINIRHSGLQITAEKITGTPCVGPQKTTWSVSFDGWSFANDGIMFTSKGQIEVGFRLVDRDRIVITLANTREIYFDRVR